MKFITRLELHSQTTRLEGEVQAVCGGKLNTRGINLSRKYGILTLFDVVFQKTFTPATTGDSTLKFTTRDSPLFQELVSRPLGRPILNLSFSRFTRRY